MKICPSLYMIACVGCALVGTQLKAADSYKTWGLALPIISFGGEGVGRFEWNLWGKGAVGLEFASQLESEFYSDQEMQEKNNDSLVMKGQELSVIYNSYGNSKMMSGGFWGVGLGYRTMEAVWLQTPRSSQIQDGISLTADGKLRHEMKTAGVTARARVGYRYVAESVPFSAGAYIGVRHFKNKFEDEDPEGEVITRTDDLGALERRMMSKLEPGIELGLAF